MRDKVRVRACMCSEINIGMRALIAIEGDVGAWEVLSVPACLNIRGQFITNIFKNTTTKIGHRIIGEPKTRVLISRSRSRSVALPAPIRFQVGCCP